MEDIKKPEKLEAFSDPSVTGLDILPGGIETHKRREEGYGAKNA